MRFARTSFAAFILMLAQSAFAGDAPPSFIAKTVSYPSKDGSAKPVTLTLPYIESENKLVALRINTLLHDQMLDTLPDPTPGISTRMVTPEAPLDEMEPAGMQVANDGRSVIVNVYTSGCGAYCSNSTSSYVFDTRNGRLLISQEMLTPTGRQTLAKKALAFARRAAEEGNRAAGKTD